ncbi:MAG: recombinase family protein [Rhizobiales bacterium]|nr:recombinase family protein [Hyphomicrobiales bacterium]
MKRCAIYTRKSTEEGLELRYNSLDAQRDACLAYVRSQSHDGWTVIDERFDDGGYSGGNLERPALRRLLALIEGGRIDVVVIHKIDRLTRSLMDFAKLAETLDRHGVSFVSVTQHLNTADSVGRLSLNILLSFAQFEREIASERIREKILASRRRGLWTGGLPPLGYDACQGKLVVNKEEAERVRLIFRRYVALGSVEDLRLELQRDGVRPKIRSKGGQNKMTEFSRGALYTLLRNVLYRGKIRCGGGLVEAVHEPIVSPELWQEAADRLLSNRRRYGASLHKASGMLLGKIFDAQGTRITRSSTSRHGKSYRYYATARRRELPKSERIRVPCDLLDQLVVDAIGACMSKREWLFSHILTSPEDRLKYAAGTIGEEDDESRCRVAPSGLLASVNKVTIEDQGVLILLSQRKLRAWLFRREVKSDEERHDRDIVIRYAASFRKTGKQLCAILTGKQSKRQRAEEILGDVRLAQSWYAGLCAGRYGTLAEIAAGHRISASTVSRRITLAFLSPAIQKRLKLGQIPDHIDRQWLHKKCPLPELWSEQELIIFGRT